MTGNNWKAKGEGETGGQWVLAVTWELQFQSAEKYDKMTCISVILFCYCPGYEGSQTAQKILNNEYKVTGDGIIFRGIYKE
jgi:hypothetical protein